MTTQHLSSIPRSASQRPLRVSSNNVVCHFCALPLVCHSSLDRLRSHPCCASVFVLFFLLVLLPGNTRALDHPHCTAAPVGQHRPCPSLYKGSVPPPKPNGPRPKGPMGPNRMLDPTHCPSAHYRCPASCVSSDWIFVPNPHFWGHISTWSRSSASPNPHPSSLSTFHESSFLPLPLSAAVRLGPVPGWVALRCL
jgi:hypothetical protein